MKKQLFLLLVLVFSTYLQAQRTNAKNDIKVVTNKITKEQSKLLYNKTKVFPNNTELSIALIENNNVNFIGVLRTNDTISLIKNHQHAFEIGSITKVFTATLLANFVIEKKLNLDDPIQDYLDVKMNTDKEISFKELANHTSGLSRLPSNLNMMFANPDNPYKNYNENKLLSFLKDEVKLNQEPGIKYEYSNLGVGLLGFVLASIADSSYELLLQEKIFKKFKMKNSTTRKNALQTKIVKGLKPKGKSTLNWEFDALSGAGALFSTVDDLSKFALAQFNSSNKELNLTQSPTFKINNNMSIGLGWHILKTKNAKELIWHNGGTGGYTSSMALDLGNKNGVIILSNISAFHNKMSNIDQLCFELMKTLENQ